MRLMERLRAGERPPVLKRLAEAEGVDVGLLERRLSRGEAVVVASLARKNVQPVVIGAGLRTKVNANLGTSEDYPEAVNEFKKLKAAEQAGADTIMDLSTGGDLRDLRQAILQRTTLPVGTVPIYEAAVKARREKGDIARMTAEDIFSVIEEHARDGVDFMTVHTGVTVSVLKKLEGTGRVTNIVSRGGTLLAGWIRHNGQENPLYDSFDRLLEIAARYDTVLSLGDGLRPGCLADATDEAQLGELKVLGKQVSLARKAGVQVMVEGPGHVPLDQIERNVKLQKEWCGGAPFYVLGPLVTDVAPGYDHIVAAIGGSLAAFYGADFLCYVTPREHLGLPNAQDVADGVVASRIAAHAGDIASGRAGAGSWDLKMARARADLDWEKQIELAINPRRARSVFEEQKSKSADACTMCGEFCALKMSEEYL